jgi:RimJ/RimL family protein N-acetyltransferase
MQVPLLATERLVLRGWRDTDREPFARLNADAKVMEHFPELLSRPASDAFVRRIETSFRERGYGLWAVERRSDGAFIGFAGLIEQTFEAPFTPAVEVGWRLALEAWGNGYATEAAREAIRFGFVQAGLDEIVSMTTLANARSRRVMEKLGMTHDPADDFEHPRVPPGPLRRHVLYRLPRARWAAVRQALGQPMRSSGP